MCLPGISIMWLYCQLLRVAATRWCPVSFFVQNTTERKGSSMSKRTKRATGRFSPHRPLRIVLTGLAAAVALTRSASAARPVQVQVDGNLLSVRAYVEQGITYVPLRSLLDAMGGWDVDWDAQEQEAVAVSAKARLTADPAEDVITLGENSIEARVTVEDGRTYVPLRKVVEALGGSVVWDPYLDGAAVTSPGAAYNAEDLYWLSRIISAESGGEPQEGQIAVGNVVLNRVASAEFPDTIPGVIFDRVDGVQFEPVENGTVYNTPTPLAVGSAKRVLDGENTVGGAMYFYAPALSEGTWINANRTYHMTIGCHRFYL